MSTYFPPSNLRDRLAGSNSDTPVLQGNMITSTYMNIINPVDSNPNISQQEVLLNFGGSRSLDEGNLNTWKDSRSEMLMMHPNMHSQGLSLSLSTNAQQSVMQIPSIPYQSDNTDFNISFENEHGYQAKQTRDNDYSVLSGLQDGASDIPPYGMTSIGRAVPNSKYLKAAQQLLDEVVNVKKAIKGQNGKKELVKEKKDVGGEVGDGGSDPSAASMASGGLQNDLSGAEKQELQNKMSKLLSMLDEVDRRYKQYYHQMQIVVSSFDVIAGSGAAKPYTALALQTISRHFRCLRDAINNHINSTRKSLGDEDISSNDKSGVGISRLRYVDQQLRQQRALQHLGMMQQHTWRPQRGLPETSVSILRAWLFEHFLHPYPKDSDKIMLARQTGLTRSQVSNWFINARVRLWKPMVEEMYKEETGDCDIDSNSSSEKTTTKASKDKEEDPQQGISTTSTCPLTDSKSDQMNDVGMMGSMDQKQSNNTTLFPDESSCGSERFIADAYHMSELERFGNMGGGGVSLTLGLQQGEGGRMAVGDSTGDHGFIPLRESDVYNMGNSAMGNETAEFDCMDSGNRRHQFVSSLLPSFT